jgi:putative effector of murein hydrolase
MMALAAYLTRFLQLLLGTTKRAQAQRAEELHRDVVEDIPLREPTSLFDRSRATSISHAASDLSLAQLAEPPQLRVQDRHYDNNTQAQALEAPSTRPPSPVLPPQDPGSPARVERYAAQLSRLADTITFAFVLIFVGIPVYFATTVTLPLHLAISVLAYQAATRLVPVSYLRFLHPVLVSSLVTVLVIWAFAAMDGVSLRAALQSYRTGTNYRALLRLGDEQADLSQPGAGDIFSSLLDASIVSLALPMFQYRRELRSHFVPIIVPNVSISVASLLAYPPLCYAIGISATRSLAFASRSLTLALATPATENLGGDTNTVAALAIISGIFGVLTGPRLLAWMKIPEGNDFQSCYPSEEVFSTDIPSMTNR